jgi:hypothetical protein
MENEINEELNAGLRERCRQVHEAIQSTYTESKLNVGAM